MRKIFVFIAFIQNIISFSQISDGGFPLLNTGFGLKNTIEVPQYKLKILECAKLNRDDKKNNTPLRYSQFEEVDLDIKTGPSASFPEGEIWQYKIVSDSAISIQVIFKAFVIPPNAKLFIYNEDKSIIYGAYTIQNVQPDSSFVVGDFKSDHLILEYFEPSNSPFKGKIIIGNIGQAYKDIFNEKSDLNGYIGINCPEGRDWQFEKHAVCKITFKVGTQGYLCSGSLINNTRVDKTPYFLTANHCIDNATSARTVVAYFNYEQKGCDGENVIYKTLSGATLMSNTSSSDYCLLKLDNIPPAIYRPYYAGWDIGDTLPKGSVGIHHPEGIQKKISIDYDFVTTHNSSIIWDEGGITPPLSHWKVEFDAGTIAGGSSGSPLFNSKKRIIGQLHGGSDNTNFYGKLSYSWTKPKIGSQKLKDFLDPDNSGKTFLDGFAPATNPPEASFYANITEACVKAPIEFYDNSVFTPESWEWSFSPASIAYLEHTKKTSKDPKINFYMPGYYNIKLKVSNINGSDSSLIESYIHAGNNIDVNILQPVTDEECLCDFDSLVVIAGGANSYIWELSPVTDTYFYKTASGDNAQVIRLKNNISFDSTQPIEMRIIGQHATCLDTLNFSFKLVKQINDEIEHALPIELGQNGLFTNKCATIENTEPVPPFTSCTGQNSWCDEYSDGTNIVENSVWFYFNGPLNSIAGLRSNGFDNQIAVYSANSYQDILNGNYTILGANDDYNDDDFNPQINKIVVNPNQKYWVQVDGSGGGSEGNFDLFLYDKALVKIHITEKGKYKIYPQPAGDYLIIESDELISLNKLRIEVYNLSGSLVYSDQVNKKSDKSIFLNTNSLEKGIFFFTIASDEKLIAGRFIK